MRLRCSLYRRIIIGVVYLLVVLVQLYFWPMCEDDFSSTLMDDFEDGELTFDPLPQNPLFPPMWSSTATGHCGNWQKQYTKIHRAITSGDLPPAYIIYTTGQGFAPNIESVPHAMKGIGTAFMLAMLTERAFILDWKSPSGFDRILSPRFIDWRSNSFFRDHPDTEIKHVHDIGSINWLEKQNGSVDWYMRTNFDEYFSNEVEIIQSLNYDFTYALLHNAHYRNKIRNLGLHTAKCKLCCFWHYLFKFTSIFSHNMQGLAKSKLGLTPGRDMMFLDLTFPRENLPKNVMKDYTTNVMSCVEKVARTLRNPVCILASNVYEVLDELPRQFPRIREKFGTFFSRERYLVELQRELNSTSKHTTVVPKNEHNALMYFFMGYYLQLNSTVLVSSHHSDYSQTMAGFRHFYHSSGRYMMYPDKNCRLQRYIY